MKHHGCLYPTRDTGNGVAWTLLVGIDGLALHVQGRGNEYQRRAACHGPGCLSKLRRRNGGPSRVPGILSRKDRLARLSRAAMVGALASARRSCT